jgi:hypothetical protein
MQLEDRCTPSVVHFSAQLGSGDSAVTLLVTIQFAAAPGDPCFVSVIEKLPNGNTIALPGDPCTPQHLANVPLHDFIPPGATRGLLEAAGVNSSMFIPPPDDRP